MFEDFGMTARIYFEDAYSFLIISVTLCIYVFIFVFCVCGFMFSCIVAHF